MLQCEVINGRGKGGPISEIQKFTKQARARQIDYDNDMVVGSVVKKDSRAKLYKLLNPFQDNFVFLDNTNGDYYCYKAPEMDVESVSGRGTERGRFDERLHLGIEEWIPMGNFGLHNYYCTEESRYKSQVKKVKAYKHNKHNIARQDLPVITSKLTDTKCELVTKFLSHYCLKGLPFEFLVT